MYPTFGEKMKWTTNNSNSYPPYNRIKLNFTTKKEWIKLWENKICVISNLVTRQNNASQGLLRKRTYRISKERDSNTHNLWYGFYHYNFFLHLNAFRMKKLEELTHETLFTRRTQFVKSRSKTLSNNFEALNEIFLR